MLIDSGAFDGDDGRFCSVPFHQTIPSGEFSGLISSPVQSNATDSIVLNRIQQCKLKWRRLAAAPSWTTRKVDGLTKMKTITRRGRVRVPLR